MHHLHQYLLCGLIAILFISPEGYAQTRPNIVFIMADDLGWGDPGCYGQERYDTPNIDRLASQGVLYTNFYVSSPVCSPSRAGIMTGQFPARNRIFGHFASESKNQERGMSNFLSPQAPSLTRILQEHGYATGHFGKWHLGHGEGAPLPDAYGIDEHLTFASNDPRGETDFNLDDPALRPVNSKLVFDEAARFVEKHRKDPFYVNVWLYDVHATLNPSEEQMQAFSRFSSRKVNFSSPATVYYATVHEMDRQLGIFMDKLTQWGLDENTIIIFTSDNGPESIFSTNAAHSGVGSPGPFRGRKRSLYEGGIRVPFVVKGANALAAGRVDDTSVMTSVDLLPTFCALAGVRLPEGIQQDGEDRSAILKGSPRCRERPIFWECNYRVHEPHWNRSPMLAVRDQHWKLLINPDSTRIELYHLADDPSETTNIATQFPEEAARLASMLLAWHRELPPSPVHPEAGKNDYPWPQGDLIGQFPDRLTFKGVAIEEKDYFTWGASPIIGDDGRTHLFAARWPKKQGMDGWKTHSEIARYAAESPEGPFNFEEVVIRGTKEKLAPHNPTITKVGDKYVLSHICNTEALSKNQKIYMMVAESVAGPWKALNGNGLVLAPPVSKDVWCYNSRVGVNNPSLLVSPAGTFHLYFKAIPTEGGLRQFGVAIADQLEGPYRFEEKPVASSSGTIEDAYAFMYDSRYYLLSRTKKDPSLKGIDGLLWQSEDGLHFDQPITGYYDLAHYHPEALKTVNWIARDGQFERPQLLLIDGKPAYLYVAGPFNIAGRDVACTYMFKIN